MRKIFSLALLGVLILSACNSANTPTAAPVTSTPVPPTTAPPTATATAIPTPTSTPLPEGVLFRDDFNGYLQPGWEWSNQQPGLWKFADSAGAQGLQITADQPGLNSDAVNVLQRKLPEGDFAITVHLQAAPGENFQQASIFIFQDAQNYVLLNSGFCQSCAVEGGFGFFFENHSTDSPQPVVLNFATRPNTATDVYLRLVRRGSAISGFFALQPDQWQLVGKFENAAPFEWIGLLAANQGPAKQGLVAFYDYFEVSLPPLPYDLTVQVLDTESNPIPWAFVSLDQSGGAQPQQVNEQGQASWKDTPADQATLWVNAQGYSAASQTVTLQRGPNQATIKLERDPFGLLPSQACAPGENLLFAEDFQDGQANGWTNLEFEVLPLGYSIDADEQGDLVLAFRPALAEGEFKAPQHPVPVADLVWRLWVKMLTEDGRVQYAMGANAPGMPQVWIAINTWGGEIHYGIPDQSDENVGKLVRNPKPGEWSFLEISHYQGHIEVWLNHVKVAAFTAKEPLDVKNLWFYPTESSDPNAVIYWNNFAACGLSAPFTPMPTPAP